MLQRAETPVALAGVEASRQFFAPCFDSQGGERLWVAHVDEEVRCIHLANYPAALDLGAVPMSAILCDAVLLESAGLILAQQHEEGSALPTVMDKAVTRALALAAEAVDVTVLDHLVFAGASCTSFRRLGLL